MFNRMTVKDADVRGKRVLVRVDFNVPLAGGSVTDDTRIRAALPTIRFLVDHGARVILASHLGRPKGEPDPEFSLRPVRRALERLIGRNVIFCPEAVGPEATAAAERMVDGEILMLENVRFYPGEKANDPEFARQLASLGEIFVNDAFGAAHRAHASTAGVAQYLPAYAGMLLSRELEMVSSLTANPERPFVVILGGSKVSEKIGVIDRFLDIADAILIGGGMVFTFLAAKGIPIGDSIVEPDWVERAGEMLAKAADSDCELILPVDFVVADAFAPDANTKIVGREEIPANTMGLDIGPTTSELFKAEIERAHTVFWNGPMGVFEMPAFAKGTREVADSLSRNSRAVSVVGGGDSAAALKAFGLEDRVSFISTGGGASLKLIEGEPLPGVEALLLKG